MAKTNKVTKEWERAKRSQKPQKKGITIQNSADTLARSENPEQSSQLTSIIFSKKSLLYQLPLFLVLAIYYYYQYYLEFRVATPLNSPLVNASLSYHPHWHWGSYRSGAYFGLQAQAPLSPVVGIMWFAQRVINNDLHIRHWCNQWDRLPKYGWTMHDGVNFGVQNIEEEDFILTTSFVKRQGGMHGGDWTSRISIVPKRNVTLPYYVSLLFYIAMEKEEVGNLRPIVQSGTQVEAVYGRGPSLGNFWIQFPESSIETSNRYWYNYLYTVAPPGFTQLKEVVRSNLVRVQREDAVFYGLRGHALTPQQQYPGFANFVVHQVTFTPPFQMEVLFESDTFEARPNKLAGSTYQAELENYQNDFLEKFEKVFHLKQKGFSKDDVKIAQEIFSNMIGSVGYFYGSSLVQSPRNKKPIEYWKAPLLTAVPSRSFFPRGFLWDEGFHNLLLSWWEPELTKTIMAHWFNLINADGWIPREQILGLEARERVPKEFIVQRDSNANPPTFFLTLESLLKRVKSGQLSRDKEFFKAIFPRVKAWYNWFNSTQIGAIPGSYRWQGRDEKAKNELNPKTLTSGLDDYPRASHPNLNERHIDLRCWLGHASGILSQLAQEINEPWEEFEQTHQYLSDNRLLEELHWSNNSNSFSDFGLHTEKVRLQRPPPPKVPPGQPIPKMDKIRVTEEQPTLRFVDQFGYVSLFPFLLKTIRPDNPKLHKVLSDLKDPDLLWTKFGLRSLSKSSSLYMKYNTEHDPPYWRGAIWININYLAIRALFYYSEVPGPYQEQSLELYRQLRDNVITNILQEYRRTGYIWENYNDRTGRGQGSHPFTGWSALVILIMAELY